jgi:glycerophosphoryl diester phosphodiesterase
LDFRQTKDGVLVVIHDRDLDRTTDSQSKLSKKNVAVVSLTHAEVSSLDAGSWHHPRHKGLGVPTLEEALDLVQGKSITMIEHKAGRADDLVELLARKGYIEDVIVQSFDWNWLREVHAADPKITIGALGEGTLDADRMKDLRGTGASVLHWDYKDLTTESIQLAQARGYLTCAYTVNSDLSLLGAAATGLYLITTTRPARLQQLIRAGKAKRRSP